MLSPLSKGIVQLCVTHSLGNSYSALLIFNTNPEGLFSRAIRESASALDYWTLYRNNKEQAARFAKKFNCPTDNSNKMAECLQSLDVHTLLDGHKDMQVIYPCIYMHRYSILAGSTEVRMYIIHAGIHNPTHR